MARASIQPWLAFGVDPGASGAVALVSSEGFADGRVIDTKEPEAIGRAVESLLKSARGFHGKDLAVRRVYIEDVFSRPGEGHVGVFSFGQAKGVPRGWFAARGYSQDFITPQVWQARFFEKRLVGADKDKRKAVILVTARMRWPEASLARAKDEATAAALFIALAGVEIKPWPSN